MSASAGTPIKHADFRLGLDAGEFAFLAFDGDAGVIADLGAQAGEGIEQRRLAAIGIAGQGDVGGPQLGVTAFVFRLFQYRYRLVARKEPSKLGLLIVAAPM
jgi:hypothetical protein